MKISLYAAAFLACAIAVPAQAITTTHAPLTVTHAPLTITQSLGTLSPGTSTDTLVAFAPAIYASTTYNDVMFQLSQGSGVSVSLSNLLAINATNYSVSLNGVGVGSGNTSTLTTFDLGNLSSGVNYTLDIDGVGTGAGSLGLLNVSVAAVPGPAGFLVAAFGALGIAFAAMLRRGRKPRLVPA